MIFISLLGDLPLIANIVLFGLAACGVWVAGTKISVYADEISDRKRIGKAFMGLIFLAAITELPELVTTITAAIEANAALLLNNMFGGIVLQTAILVAADAVIRQAPLTSYPRNPTPVLEASFLLLLLALLMSVISIGEAPLVAHVGYGTVLLAAAYALSLWLLRNLDNHSASWTPIEIPEERDQGKVSAWRRDVGQISFSALTWRSVAAAGVILFCGVLLVELADTIARQSGLGSSFIGVTLLAASTSLPELSTTVMAVRLRSYTMAISNIFGSNLIMLVLLLPADFFYTPGPLLAHVDRSAAFALIAGMIVTVIYVIGLVVRRNRKIFGMGLDSVAVLAVYLTSLVIFYLIR